MIKRPQILCPAIGWRHSVYSNPFKNSKTRQAHTFCHVFRLRAERNRSGEHREVAGRCVDAGKANIVLPTLCFQFVVQTLC